MTEAEIKYGYESIIPFALNAASTHSVTAAQEVKEVVNKRASGTLNTSPGILYSRTGFSAFAAEGNYDLVGPTQVEQQGLSSFDKQKIDDNEYFLVTGSSIGHLEHTAGTKPEQINYKRLLRSSGGISTTILTSKIVFNIEGSKVLEQEGIELAHYGADENLLKAGKPFLLKGGRKFEAKLQLAKNINSTGGGNDEYVELLLFGYRMANK